jgi:hypothetical protein
MAGSQAHLIYMETMVWCHLKAAAGAFRCIFQTFEMTSAIDSVSCFSNRGRIVVQGPTMNVGAWHLCYTCPLLASICSQGTLSLSWSWSNLHGRPVEVRVFYSVSGLGWDDRQMALSLKQSQHLLPQKCDLQESWSPESPPQQWRYNLDLGLGLRFEVIWGQRTYVSQKTLFRMS